MKKNIIVLAALLTALTAFTGCGNDSSSSSSKSDAAATTAASTEASSEATTEAASKTTTAKKTTEATTEATTESTADLDFEELAGHWIYEEQDAGSTEEYVGTPKGSVDIAVDGRYAYNDGSSLITGSIELTYEEYADGSKVPMLVFTHDDGNFFIGCYINDETDIASGPLYIGNGGMSRLVRDNGSSENEEEPNFYGFYEYKEPMRENAGFNSVKSIEGSWLHGQFVLEITDCDEYMGAFHDDNEGGEYVGTVRLEYSKNADGTTQLWYNLYTNDGGLFKSFKATQEVPLDSLFDECTNGIEHTRIILEQ